MAKLIYAAITSLDGYIEDADGNFAWSAPDEEVHAFINDLERDVGTYLYGRRMYETMAVWETLDVADEPPAMRDYAEIWRAADKVVYSRTLAEPPTARTRIESRFDPAAVVRMKQDAERDISIGGAELAANALRAGLVDELHLFLNPVIVGAGKPALPGDIRLRLELLDERRFTGGVVHLHYELGSSNGSSM
jgi:dihydrofolate reductase